MSAIYAEELDFGSQVAIYLQICNIIRSKIESGILDIGDPIGTESELCKSLGVSRTTVRLAFAELEQDGLIVRMRSKGTFVSHPKVRRSLNDLYNFTGEMHLLGLTPSSRVIEFSLIKAPQKILTPLQLTSEDMVYKIKRLRLADGTPMLLETAYIPRCFCPNITEADLADSLYAVISQYNQAFPFEAEETYDAILLKESDAMHLKCPTGSPAFSIRRISRNTKGQLFEYAILIAPGSVNRYQIVLRKNDILFSHRKVANEK